MLGFFKTLFAIIGVIATVLTIAVVWLVWDWIGSSDEPAAPDRIALRIDVGAGLPDAPPTAGLAALLGASRPTLAEAVAALETAGTDARVQAVILDLGTTSPALTTAQELGDAVARFRATGRPVYAFADSFGELAPAEGAVLLAAQADEVSLRPVGMMGLAGLSAEVPFAAGALESLGITAEVARRGDYKTFPDTFTETELSPAYREMLSSLLGDLSDQVSAGIAGGRGLSDDALAAAIDRGPLTADEALELGLVDHLESRTAFNRRVDQAHPGASVVSLADYAAIAPVPEPSAHAALVHLNGVMVVGEDSGSPSLLGDGAQSAQRIADAIDAAVADGVIAVLIRMDSPGGSPVAAAIIADAVAEAREAGVPVVVSMGQTAASGAYWAAAGADAIVAEPATQTGSIGVFAGGLATADFWESLGVNWDRVEAGGDNAGFWSTVQPYDTAERARLEALVQAIYDAFLDHVAAGRGLDRAAVEAVAQGRVWTGRQALENGLVDRLGGLETALDLLREEAGLAPDAVVALHAYPPPRSALDDIGNLLATGPAVADGGLVDRVLSQPAARALLEPLLASPGQRLVRTPSVLLMR
ncbi:MAG: S49 family peptidase [Rhodospirillaceae bacterium]|nr:S49 family peptidase [Rhodospirillaceae bacterium]